MTGASASEDEMDERSGKVEHARSTGPERIWLSPCCDPERTWCQDAVFEVCDCGAGPVEYIRADLAAPKTAAASADPAADLALVASLRTISEMKAPFGNVPKEELAAWRAADAIERLLRERDEARWARDQNGVIAEDMQQRAITAQSERDAALRERDEARRLYESQAEEYKFCRKRLMIMTHEVERLEAEESAALAKGREEAAQELDKMAEHLRGIWGQASASMAKDNLMRHAAALEVAARAIRALSPSSPGEPLPPAADEIERVARAICAEYGDDYDEQAEDITALRALRKGQGGDGEVYAHDPGLPTREDWRKMAAAGLAARRRSPGEPAGSGWQPIATAPKDGTYFDAWYRNRRMTNVYWSDVQDWWCVDGKYGPEDPTPLAIGRTITHWMPLPAPPHEPVGET